LSPASRVFSPADSDWGFAAGLAGTSVPQNSLDVPYSKFLAMPLITSLPEVNIVHIHYRVVVLIYVALEGIWQVVGN